MVKKILRNLILGASSLFLLYSGIQHLTKDQKQNFQIPNYEYMCASGDSISTKQHVDSIKTNSNLSDLQSKTMDYVFDKKYFNKEIYDIIANKDLTNNHLVGIQMITKKSYDVKKAYLDSILADEYVSVSKGTIFSGLSDTNIKDANIIDFVENEIDKDVNFIAAVGINSLLRSGITNKYFYKQALKFKMDDLNKATLLSKSQYAFAEQTNQRLSDVDTNVKEHFNMLFNYKKNISDKQKDEYITLLDEKEKDINKYKKILK